MIAEQEYFRQKLRRHNRFMHGWGVVCGLAVEPAPTRESPWRVRVTDGYALGLMATTYTYLGQCTLTSRSAVTADRPIPASQRYFAVAHQLRGAQCISPSSMPSV